MGKEEILRSVRKNKPTLIPLPEINLDTFNETIDLLANFKEKVALVGGTIKELSALNEIDREITKLFPNARNIVDCTKSSSLGTVSISEKTQPQDLEGVDLAIIPGAFGVAENGAIWISDDRFPIRILPFITKDLLIVLEKKMCACIYTMPMNYFQKEIGLLAYSYRDRPKRPILNNVWS